jgi:hypothetical protein
MKKHLNAGFVLLLFMALSVMAHAGGSSNPCGLLTKDEAEAFAGEAVTSPELKDTKNPLGQKMCLYNTVSSRLIQISVIRTADMAPDTRKHGQTAAKVYKSTKEMLEPVEPVQGVGDDAFWGTPGLHILKGDIYALISVGNTSKRENLELAKRIAAKVLPRL